MDDGDISWRCHEIFEDISFRTLHNKTYNRHGYKVLDRVMREYPIKYDGYGSREEVVGKMVNGKDMTQNIQGVKQEFQHAEFLEQYIQVVKQDFWSMLLKITWCKFKEYVINQRRRDIYLDSDK